MTLPLMLFAAGFGTRMGDLTRDRPKPMVEIAGRPLIDHAIDMARAAGITHIVANTHYMPDVIAPYLRRNGVIESAEQPEILDTGGGLKKARDLLGDGPVLTLNTDAVFSGPNPLLTLMDNWRSGMDALLLVVPCERTRGRDAPGDFTLAAGRLQRRGDDVYTGAQIIDPRVLDAYTDSVFSLSRVWTDLAARDSLYGLRYPGDWIDVGHPVGVTLAEEIIAGV